MFCPKCAMRYRAAVMSREHLAEAPWRCICGHPRLTFAARATLHALIDESLAPLDTLVARVKSISPL